MFDVIEKVLDVVVPDPVERAKADAELKKADNEGRLEPMKLAFKAILAEAQSKHKAVALARPAFLWLMYAVIAYIFFVIPPLFVWKPDAVRQGIEAIGLALDAIPLEMWAMMTFVMTGYQWSRSKDKENILKAQAPLGLLGNLGGLLRK